MRAARIEFVLDLNFHNFLV